MLPGTDLVVPGRALPHALDLRIARLRCQTTLDRGAGRSGLAPPLRLDERGVDHRLEACARVRLVLIERPEPLGVDHDDARVVLSPPGDPREPRAGCGR